jgi:hypothetical protein
MLSICVPLHFLHLFIYLVLTTAIPLFEFNLSTFLFIYIPLHIPPSFPGQLRGPDSLTIHRHFTMQT